MEQLQADWREGGQANVGRRSSGTTAAKFGEVWRELAVGRALGVGYTRGVQRIGGGILRGRKLRPLPAGISGVRPTGARVREAISARGLAAAQITVLDALLKLVHDFKRLRLFSDISMGRQHVTQAAEGVPNGGKADLVQKGCPVLS